MFGIDVCVVSMGRAFSPRPRLGTFSWAVGPGWDGARLWRFLPKPIKLCQFFQQRSKRTGLFKTVIKSRGQNERSAPLANCEHMKWATVGRTTQHGGIDTTALSTIVSVALNLSALWGSGRVKPPEL